MDNLWSKFLTTKAMSQYEFLDLLFTAIQILIDIITRLRQKRHKGKRNKK